MREIRPIAELDRRMPRAGKIKAGVKSGRAMKSISEWRFISPHEDAIRSLAAQYGGDPHPFSDPTAVPKDQWEVLTNAPSIDVMLMVDGLDCAYEQWSNGGCVRRCDGETCAIPVKSGDHDYEMVDVRCLCTSEGERSCDVKTRLTVILPDTPFHGGWLLETKSWAAAEELPGMHDLILELGAGRMTMATLTIEKRSKKTVAGGRNFVVPVLGMKQTAMELQQGMASAAAIAAAGTPVVVRPALPAGAPQQTPLESDDRAEWRGDPEVDQRLADRVHADSQGASPDDDDIVDAEIIDPEDEEIDARLYADAEQFGLDPQRFVDAMRRRVSIEPTIEAQRDALRKASSATRAGTAEPLGFKADGTIQWKAIKR